MVSEPANRPYPSGRSKDWIKMLWAGGRRGGCGTLGALSNETNGAPHVAIF
jgi:hypothetical protein